MSNRLNDLLDFLFPRFCVMCGRRLTTQEKHLCLPCYIHLPRTQYHMTEHSEMEKLFWGWGERFPIQQAVAFFHYTGDNKEILLQLKYKKNPQIGTHLASQFAKEILADGSTFFRGIDLIVPVPLHWKRYLKRSYNQSEYVAEGISKVTGIPICRQAVGRIRNNKSQTLVRHEERRDNVKDIFRLIHPEMLTGRHVLIIDDVTTTGSTVTSLAMEIAKAGNMKVSILTIAIAGQTLTPPDDSASLPYISVSPANLSRL